MSTAAVIAIAVGASSCSAPFRSSPSPVDLTCAVQGRCPVKRVKRDTTRRNEAKKQGRIAAEEAATRTAADAEAEGVEAANAEQRARRRRCR